MMHSSTIKSALSTPSAANSENYHRRILHANAPASFFSSLDRATSATTNSLPVFSTATASASAQTISKVAVQVPDNLMPFLSRGASTSFPAFNSLESVGNDLFLAARASNSGSAPSTGAAKWPSLNTADAAPLSLKDTHALASQGLMASGTSGSLTTEELCAQLRMQTNAQIMNNAKLIDSILRLRQERAAFQQQGSAPAPAPQGRLSPPMSSSSFLDTGIAMLRSQPRSNNAHSSLAMIAAPSRSDANSTSAAMSSLMASLSNHSSQNKMEQRQRLLTHSNTASPTPAMAFSSPATSTVAATTTHKVVDPTCLSIEQDANWLNESQCFLRSEFLELTHANRKEVLVNGNTRMYQQVGIRCRFCVSTIFVVF